MFGLVSQQGQRALYVSLCVQKVSVSIHMGTRAFSEACDEHTVQQSLWLTLCPSHAGISSTSKGRTKS